MTARSSKSANVRTYIPLPGTIASITAIGLNTHKSHGEAAEAAFLARAAAFGFGVAKPWGDSERYDFVLDSGHKFWRVQVKSTERFAGSRYHVKAAGWKDDYTRDEIDFIVAYIVPEDVWYVVPIAACVHHKSLRFYPGAGRKARLEKFREAWCLLACPRQTSTPLHLPRHCRNAAGEDVHCPFHQQARPGK